MPQGGSTDPAETGRGELVLQGRLYGMDKATAQARADEVLAALDLEAAADRPTGTYSGGMRRRLDVGLGIVHRPQVLFLDEPTTGLDPQARARMWDEIRGLRERGTTVFLTTHYLEEADALADRLAIIDHGKIVAEGTADELKRQVAGDVITLGVDGDREQVLATVRDQAVRPRGEHRGRADPPLRRPGRDRRPAAPADPRRRRAARPARSRSPGRASTTSSCARPAGRSERSRRHERDRPTYDVHHDRPTRNPSCRPLRDTWLIFHRSLVADHPPAGLGHLRDDAAAPLPRSCSGRCSKAPTQAAGAGTNAFNWFVPGLLIQIAIFGTAFGGFGLIAELRDGVIERMRVTPMSRTAMLLGRSLRDVVILQFQAIILIVLAIPFGLDVDPAGIAGGPRPARPHRAGRWRPLSYARGADAQERGRLRAARQRHRDAAAAAVGDPAADGPGAGLAPVPQHAQPADPCGRCGPGAVQRRVGRPGDRRSASAITAVLAVISVWIAARTFSRANA